MKVLVYYPFEAGQTRPAEIGRDVDVHEAHLMRLCDQVGGVQLEFVVLGSLRPDLLLRELAGQRPELPLLWCKREGNAAGYARLDRCHDPTPLD